jgi:hypothetical protein
LIELEFGDLFLARGGSDGIDYFVGAFSSLVILYPKPDNIP